MFENTNGNGMYMPVAPAYGGGNGGFGFGGDWGWIILLLLCGWGGMGMGGFGGWGGMMGLGYDFPWLLNGQNQINANTNAGFDHAATQSALGNLSTAVTSGFGDVQLGIAGVNQAICQTGNGVTAAVTGAQNALAQQLYTNQLADLERSYAAQTASTQGMTALQSQLASCCCENRLATADTKYTIATEACASRAASADNTQKILDKLCALELDGVKAQLAQAQRDNVGLQNALNMATMRESQTAQTAQILAGQAAEIDGVYNRLKNCPVGTYSVCNPNIYPGQGCGCGGAAFVN